MVAARATVAKPSQSLEGFLCKVLVPSSSPADGRPAVDRTVGSNERLLNASNGASGEGRRFVTHGAVA
jgi:hypothetical protein